MASRNKSGSRSLREGPDLDRCREKPFVGGKALHPGNKAVELQEAAGTRPTSSVKHPASTTPGSPVRIGSGVWGLGLEFGVWGLVG